MDIKYIQLEEYLKMSYETQQLIKMAKNDLRILVKYEDPSFKTLHITEKGNWIDIKCAEDYIIQKDEFYKLNLGIAMKLPDGYEAYLAPRSGTFEKYGLIQTNSIGIIDNSYSGNNDIWKMPVYATRDSVICKGERLCQFRIAPTMESMAYHHSASIGMLIVEVDTLDDDDRGGFGSSGR